MNTPPTCQMCGEELTDAAAEGLCPQCVLQAAAQEVIMPPGQADSTLPTGALEDRGATIGRYKLLEKLGEGGFGVVWVAEQRRPVRRRVALKIIKLGMDTKQVVARFEAERQALALMDHPNIAKVLDAGATETGRPYFVMELVKGVPITQYCDQEKVSTPDRLGLFIEVCQAIQHAHQKGIIHRDIKPSNIMITLHDGAPVPRVIDFGIAKATQQELTEKTVYTQYSQFIGTPAYMSPEQAELSGLDIDTRSDIYGLGVLLYELLTGSTPFDTQELVQSGLDQMRKIIREREPVKPSTRLSQTLSKPGNSSRLATGHSPLATDLDWIVMKCLEKDRSRRYDTANGLALDIKRHLGNEPVVARPPSAAYKFQKAWQRNKVVYSAVVAVAAVLIVGITFSTWQAVEAGLARDAEAGQRKTAQNERDRARLAEKNEAEQRQRAEAGEANAERALYAANMNLAQQAWEQDNLAHVTQLLDDAASYGEKGFEWYYWQRQTHRELSTLRGHIGDVMVVAFSPDGRRIVTGSSDQTARVWDTASGQELVALLELPLPCPFGITGAAFSPNGERIALASVLGTATLWDSRSGQHLLTLAGHSGPVWSVAFSPDGQHIITGGTDWTAKVWDANNGDWQFDLVGHSDVVWSVSYSRDSRRILTGGGDGTARVWDAATGQSLLILAGHSEWVFSAAFSPDGTRIVTGSHDDTVKVWDAMKGGEALLEVRHDRDVKCVSFSPDGQQILTCSEDRTTRVWDSDTGEERLTLRGHVDHIWSAAFSPDGRRIATGSLDDTAKLWDATRAQERFTGAGHGASVVSDVAYSQDGTRIVSGGWDHAARIWDTVTGRELLPLMGHKDRIWSVAISSDGRRVVTGSWDQTARVWDATTGQEMFQLLGHTAGVRSVAYSSDDTLIATAAEDHSAKIWDADRGSLIGTLAGHTDRVWAVAISPDGSRIVTGSADRTAMAWSVDSGQRLKRLSAHSHWVSAVAFSPDGQRILTGSRDNTCVVWDANTGEALLTLQGHTDGIASVAFSPDGRRIIAGSEGGAIKCWDATDGREVLTIQAPGGRVRSLAFSPDGNRIVAAGGVGLPSLWEAASPEEVTTRQKNEQVAQERLEDRRRDQAATFNDRLRLRRKDPGAIKQWLVLAPLPFGGQMSTAEALDLEQIDGEGGIRPRPGQRVTLGDQESIWRTLLLDDYLLDFGELIGEYTTYKVAYAVCYIDSGTEQTGLKMKVGSDDDSKVYLNGQLIYRNPFHSPYVPDAGVVDDVTLQQGINCLVFKVVDGVGQWLGSIRFTDENGNPVKGIRVTLDPDDKTHPGGPARKAEYTHGSV